MALEGYYSEKFERIYDPINLRVEISTLRRKSANLF